MSKLKGKDVITGAMMGVLSLALMSCSDSSNNSQGTGVSSTAVKLAISYTPQQTQIWCWAATTSEVLQYYGYPNYQCQLVSLVVYNDVQSCCFSAPGCQVAGSTQNIRDLISFVSNSQLSTAVIPAPLSFDQIKNEIDGRRPIIVFYIGSFLGHFVVIYGYDATSGEIFIHDPFYGSFIVPYGSTFSYNGQLVWGQTILFN